MPLYRVAFAPAAAREFRKIKDRATKRRLAEALGGLADNPRPSGIEKLEGSGDLFRIRIGAYRVVFQIRDDELLVLVVRIAHRGIVYKRGR